MQKPPERAKADPTKWSEKSKRSTSYLLSPDSYKDIRYKCRGCGIQATFTADQQKEQYEVRKTYIGAHRILCERCHENRIELQKISKDYQSRWKSEKATIIKDISAIQDWIRVLETLACLGAGKDHAKIAMLRKISSVAV